MSADLPRSPFFVALGLGVLTVAGCGASPPPAAPGRPLARAEAAPRPPTPASEGTIPRGDLDPVLAAGIGRFLRGMETEPHLEDGRFVGFRLTALRSPHFAGVDLREGDTVVSINGRSVERPEQAMAIWQGLVVASELTVEYLRDGEARQLRFGIVDAPAEPTVDADGATATGDATPAGSGV